MKPTFHHQLLTTIVVLLTMYGLSAQAPCPPNLWDASNVGSAYVDELGSKAIFGGFTNSSDAQHVNDGRLYFFGDITNDGFIGDGFGYEYIRACDNDSPTIVSGNGATEFNILDIDNTAGVTVQKDLRIKTNITFSSGVVHTDRTKFGHRVYFQEGATHRASSDNRHVDGRISRKGIGNFSFPTGDGDHISKLDIAPTVGSDLYTAAYYSEQLSPEGFTAEGLFDRSQTEFDVLRVQEKEHWTLRGSQPTTITLHFTRYSDISALTNDTEDLIVVGWDGRKWVDLGNTKLVSAFGIGAVTSSSIVPNRYRAYTFGVRDTDGDLYADALDIDPRDPCVPDATSPACGQRVCVEVNLKVYLEGGMMGGGIGSYQDHMKSMINFFGYLPGQAPFTLLGKGTAPGQPYHISPWNHEGSEGFQYNSYLSSGGLDYHEDVVDWVLVSLRTDEGAGSTVCTKAGILYADGAVEMTEPFDCCNSNDTDYYIVIEHRNHLPIMTPTPMPVVDGIVAFDFTSNQSYIRLLGSGQKEVKDGVYAMYAGNGDQVSAGESPKDINSNDVSMWAAENGEHSGYYLQDYDLNGDVNVHDKAIWLMNNGIFTDVDR